MTMCHNIVTQDIGVGLGVDWKKGGTLCGLRIHRYLNPVLAANPSNTAEDGLIAPGT